MRDKSIVCQYLISLGDCSFFLSPGFIELHSQAPKIDLINIITLQVDRFVIGRIFVDGPYVLRSICNAWCRKTNAALNNNDNFTCFRLPTMSVEAPVILSESI